MPELSQVIHPNTIQNQKKHTSMSTLPNPKLTKVCTQCKVERPITDFPKAHNYTDGRCSNCNHCRLARYHARQAEKKKMEMYFTY